MKTRALFAALAVASLAAPLAAYADAPSGEINTIFAVDESVKVDPPKFDRREHSQLRRGHPGSANIVIETQHGDARASSRGAGEDAAGPRRRLNHKPQ